MYVEDKSEFACDEFTLYLMQTLNATFGILGGFRHVF